MVNTVPSENGNFLFFKGFLNIKSGITTRKFGDCNSYYLPLCKNPAAEKKCTAIAKLTGNNFFHRMIPRHNDGICFASNSNENCDYSCDALALYKGKGKAGNLLLAPTGDCPMVIIECERGFGIIHSGYKCARLNIAVKTIGRFISFFSAESENIKAIIWPGIRGDCYEVGPEFIDYFGTENVYWLNGSFRIDLAKLIKKQMISAGMLAHNIAIVKKYCSFCNNDLFFSARRGDKERNLIFAHTP